MFRIHLTLFPGNGHARWLIAAALVICLVAMPAVTWAANAQLGERLLSRGDRGDDVRALQRALKGAGYNVGWIDGVYGPATETQVKAFQRRHGLRVTGRADALTIRRLLVKEPIRDPLVVEAAGAPATHVVQRGDTLSDLAVKYDTTVRALMDLNGLRSTTIIVGRVLKVPGMAQTSWEDTTYRVQRGDMLSTLASKFGTTVQELKGLNGLRSDLIRVGQLLRVPGSGGAANNGTPSPGTPTSYLVKPGDTLSEIAAQYHTTIQNIMQLNGLRSTTIIVGQRLQLARAAGTATAAAATSGAGPVVHKVRAGESLWSIAATYGVTISDLKRANNLSRSIIYVGERLKIPGTSSGVQASATVSGEAASLLKGKVIVLDPGHGGEGTAGTYGITSGVHESVIVMDVARRLEKLLSEGGARVVLTREEDGSPVGPAGGTVDLEARVALAEKVGADLFLSIHSNWSDDPEPSGVISFYYYGKNAGKALASALQPDVVDTTHLKDRGVRSSGYYVVHHTTMPAALVELGFMSNADDEALLLQADFRQRAAEGLFNGLVSYFKNH